MGIIASQPEIRWFLGPEGLTNWNGVKWCEEVSPGVYEMLPPYGCPDCGWPQRPGQRHAALVGGRDQSTACDWCKNLLKVDTYPDLENFGLTWCYECRATIPIIAACNFNDDGYDYCRTCCGCPDNKNEHPHIFGLPGPWDTEDKNEWLCKQLEGDD